MISYIAVRGAIIAIFVTIACSAEIDPCINGNVLHKMEQRHTSYHSAYNKYICDKYKIAVGGQWFTIHHNMPTKPPDLFKCGTKFPIWLNGSIPSSDDGIVTRDACQVAVYSNCQLTYKIKIKKCAGYFVYFLKPTNHCPAAYCFGDGQYGGTIPDFRTTPKLRPSLIGVETNNKGKKQKTDHLIFSCEFEPSTKEEHGSLLYFVEWVVDEKVVWISPSVNKSELAKTNLEETYLSKLNIQITCKVGSRYQESGDPGPMSSSERFFAGVQVDKHHLYIPVSGSANFSFRLTVPFGCLWENRNGVSFEKTDCNIDIDMSVSNVKESCFGVAEIPNCGIQIPASQWSKQHFLTVRWMDGEYYDSKPSKLDLKINTLDHLLWDILFPSIKVTPIVHHKWKGKSCSSLNDPHQRTFNNRHYENQNKGNYTLYRHQDKNTPMEVQYKTYPCGSAFCMCGAAVRAGGDLFVIDRCDDTHSVANFITCGDNILDARTTKENENIFKIFFPTGTEVRIRVYGISLNIRIRASANDWKKTEGLCGFLSDNSDEDFRLRNGSLCSGDLYRSNRHPDDFSLSWRVPDDENLFEVKENEIIGRWDSNDTYCGCNGSQGILTELNCSYESRVTCLRDKHDYKIGCKIHLGNLPSPGKRRKKRSVEQQSNFVNMTKQEAEKYCRDFMFGSKAFNACESVPNVRTAEAIDICILDIQLTSTLDWVNQTLENIKANCIGELRKNYTLQEEGDDGSPSVAELITDLLCPGNPECNKRGQCINGACICQEGFISPDCSVDMTYPPEIFGLRGDGLCYTNEISCDTVYLVGIDIYKSVHLSCSFRRIKTNSRGKTHFIEESPLITAAHHDTISEVWCQPPKRPQFNEDSSEDMFIYGYEIKMSYDRKHFGDPFTFYAVDSRCIVATTNLEKTTFRIEKGMCFIRGECFFDGNPSTRNSCLVCDSRLSQSDWSTIEGCPTKPLVHDDSDVSRNVIAVIIGISGFAIISIVTILIILRYLRSKKGKWDVAEAVYQQEKNIKISFKESSE